MCFCNCERSSDAVRSRDIDRNISRSKTRSAREVNILLLGVGESGKSTMLKQMKLIYSRGFDRHERLQWRLVIFRNIVDTFRTIYEAMVDLNYGFDNPDNEVSLFFREYGGQLVIYRDKLTQLLQKLMARILVRHKLGHEDNFPQYYFEAIKALWHDSGVKAALAKGNEYAVHDNLAYFIDHLPRIWADGYIPNDLDILFSRLRTMGINEIEFDLGKLTYRMIDVGGQRSERKKWIHYFDNVHCVLFFVAITGYDQCLLEDKGGNQMMEALMLWESIVNSPWLKNSAMILFFNKMDLFMEKLPLNPISKYGFTDYRGRHDDYKAVSKYFLDKFRVQSRQSDKEIYGHFLSATDTNLVKNSMGLVQDIIIRRNVEQLNVML